MVHISYLIWAAIIILAIAITLRILNNRRVRKVKEQLKAQWGKPKTGAFDFDSAISNLSLRASELKNLLTDYHIIQKDNIVIIATHDIELAEMLKSEYDLYHFTETIERDQLYFDHRLKAGSLKTRNAIKLLELADYPADVIREAKELSARLGK
jgi:hypothetical protein